MLDEFRFKMQFAQRFDVYFLLFFASRSMTTVTERDYTILLCGLRDDKKPRDSVYNRD